MSGSSQLRLIRYVLIVILVIILLWQILLILSRRVVVVICQLLLVDGLVLVVQVQSVAEVEVGAATDGLLALRTALLQLPGIAVFQVIMLTSCVAGGPLCIQIALLAISPLVDSVVLHNILISYLCTNIILVAIDHLPHVLVVQLRRCLVGVHVLLLSG